MRSTTGSTVHSPSAVARAAVVTHGTPEAIADGFERLLRVAEDAGVRLLLAEDERRKHASAGAAPADDGEADLAVVLGGDGTMLRALNRFLGTGVPVLGVNFGRVGFLATIPAAELESGLSRAFAGEYAVVELSTLVATVGERSATGLNDIVARSSDLGRMVELDWAIGDESLGRMPCDGVICSTPSGSTAYNLSNGGPVLVWGLDAMAITFVAPHSLQARPLVVPKDRDLTVCNRTTDVEVTVLVDGHRFAELGEGDTVRVALDDRRSLLATLPETTFFRRYRETFS